MSGDDGLSTFERRLAERRAAREEVSRKKQVEFSPELIPVDDRPRSEEDLELDRIIDGIDILDAYKRWCGKMTPNPKGKKESIMISCPVPGHADKHPSAWINLDKQTWYCGACSQGGDSYDIAAFHFGYPVPGYKDGANFHNLRREMAKDLGYTFTVLPGDVVEVVPPHDTGKVIGDEPTSEQDNDDAEVIELFEGDPLDDSEFLGLDWRSIVPKDTYLRAYMDATCIDDLPEEYHFWNALLGLGFALGRDVRLFDFIPVYGNLFVCTLGRSGTGKSRARAHLDKLLVRALPHDWSDPNSKGVRKISSPASAEVLIHNFSKPVEDPANPKRVAYYAAVRGLVDYSELSGLVGRANRQGNVTVPTLMQFYDMENVVATSSMTHGSKEAHEPFGSALTTTQPKALRSLLSKADDASGFLNRWVFVPGREKQRFAIGGVQVDMEPVVPYLESIVGWAASFKTDEVVTWSEEAATKFTHFFHFRIEPDKSRSQTDLLIRIDLLMKKLILLFSANKKEKVVTEETVKEAIACYDYVVAAYKIPEAHIGNTLQNEVSDAILNVVQKNDRGLTLNEIARMLKRRKYPNDLLLKTADTLVKLGFIEVVTTKPGSVGRPTTRYKSVS